jgi:hypothetical protein
VKLWSDADRTLDFQRGVDELQTQLRAFGRFECLAEVNKVLFHVRRAAAWREPHRFPPGPWCTATGRAWCWPAAMAMWLCWSGACWRRAPDRHRHAAG